MLHPLYNLIFEISFRIYIPPLPQYFIMSKLLGKANSSKILLLEGPNRIALKIGWLHVLQSFFYISKPFGLVFYFVLLLLYYCIIVLLYYYLRRQFFLYNLKFGRLETDTIAFFMHSHNRNLCKWIYVKRPITY
jgi:hypothetical protein